MIASQWQIQLANPLPYDLDAVRLDEYKPLDAASHDWREVKRRCANTAQLIFERITGLDAEAD